MAFAIGSLVSSPTDPPSSVSTYTNDVLFSGGTCVSIFVGTTGNVNLVLDDGSSGVYMNIPSGTRLTGRFKMIKSASTTASNIIIEYGD